MKLETIQTDSNWGSEAANLNTNFQKVSTAVDKLEYATTRFKGYFPTEDFLKSSVPKPAKGEYSWVGEPYPGVVYDCITSGTWRKTTTVPNAGDLTLTGYAKTEEVLAVQNNLAQIERDVSSGINVVAFYEGGYVNSSGGISKTTEVDKHKYIMIPVSVSDIYIIISDRANTLNAFMSNTTTQLSTFSTVIGKNEVIIPEGTQYLAVTLEFTYKGTKQGNWKNQAIILKTADTKELYAELDNFVVEIDEMNQRVSDVEVRMPETYVKNLFNKNNILQNKYQSSSEGCISPEIGWQCYVAQVEPDTIYTLSGNKERVGLGFYTQEYPEQVSKAVCTKYLAMNLGTFTTDSNTKSICFNLASPALPNWSNIQLEKGSVATLYTEGAIVKKENIEGLDSAITNSNTALQKANDSNVLATEVNEKLGAFDIKEVESENRLNSNTIIPKALVDDVNGTLIYIGVSPNYDTFDFNPVKGNTTYKGLTSSGSAQSFRKGAFYNENKVYISGFDKLNTFTTPANAAYTRLSVENNTSGYNPANIGLFEGTSPVWEPYYSCYIVKLTDTSQSTENKAGDQVATIDDVKNISKPSPITDGAVKFVKSGNDVIFSFDSGSIRIGLNSGNNGQINFKKTAFKDVSYSNDDDTAPDHIMGTTLGANHGQPYNRATFNAAHGLTNADIGTEWIHSNGKKYYPIEIISTNVVGFLSEFSGTRENYSFLTIPVGTITRNGTTLTISSTAKVQFYPGTIDPIVKVLANGIFEISDDGNYSANYVDIVERYSVKNYVDILTNLIAAAGNINPPAYTANPMITYENIYRFLPNGNVLVITNRIANQNLSFQNYMFTQAFKMVNGNVVSYYVPNSLPVSGYDFRKPLLVDWSSSIPSIYFRAANWQDSNNPANRVIQYYQNTGFMVGFLKDYGVGKALQDFTEATFELRNNTGKVYPHGVDNGKIGNTMLANKVYNTVMFRSFSDLSKTRSGNRMSVFNFSYNGSEYVFIDYSGSMSDRVIIDSGLNGKKIEIIEFANTVLENDVYNEGIYIKSDYVEGETCFIVLKIT